MITLPLAIPMFLRLIIEIYAIRSIDKEEQEQEQEDEEEEKKKKRRRERKTTTHKQQQQQQQRQQQHDQRRTRKVDGVKKRTHYSINNKGGCWFH